MSDTGALVGTDEPQDKQAEAKKAEAPEITRDELMGKKARRRKFEVTLDEEQGPRLMHLVALGRTAYEKLQSAHEPTPKQMRNGADVNADTFVPALLAAVVRTPQLTVDDWAELWASPDWAAGEITSLFSTANGLCREQLDLTPFG